MIFDDSLDHLDPQLSYTTEGWQALWSVYLPLLTYRHEAGSPFEDASAKPLPATGPYRLIRPPGTGFALIRNPHWQPIPGIPSGYANRISVEVTGDAGAALTATWSGTVDYTTHQIPLPEVKATLAAHGERIRRGTPGNTYYAFLNVEEEPFDRLAVRKAVELAIDRERFVDRLGGLATPTRNVLPPGYPSYRKLALYPYDPARARRELAKAGAAGARVTVWTSDRESYRSLADEFVAQLKAVGLAAELKVLDDAIYFTAVADRNGHAQIGIANWLQDYVHPVNWFGGLLTGAANDRSPDQNLANADVPALNELVALLSAQPVLTVAGNAGWARADRIALEQALWIPLLNRQFTDALVPRVDLRCAVGHVLYGLDLARLCVG